jgi:hypothetical protein
MLGEGTYTDGDLEQVDAPLVAEGEVRLQVVATVVSQWCHSAVTVVLQRCYSGVKSGILKRLPWCYRDVTGVLKWYYEEVTVV